MTNEKKILEASEQLKSQLEAALKVVEGLYEKTAQGPEGEYFEEILIGGSVAIQDWEALVEDKGRK